METFFLEWIIKLKPRMRLLLIAFGVGFLLFLYKEVWLGEAASTEYMLGLIVVSFFVALGLTVASERWRKNREP